MRAICEGLTRLLLQSQFLMLPKGDAVPGTKAAAEITAGCNYKTSGGAVVSDQWSVVSEKPPKSFTAHQPVGTDHCFQSVTSLA
jgi:hypothetical protein